MKREEVIKILKNNVRLLSDDSNTYGIEESDFESIADELLAEPAGQVGEEELKVLFELEQQLDIPHKDRFYNSIAPNEDKNCPASESKQDKEQILTDFAKKMSNQKDIDPEIAEHLTPDFFKKLAEESNIEQDKEHSEKPKECKTCKFDLILHEECADCGESHANWEGIEQQSNKAIDVLIDVYGCKDLADLKKCFISNDLSLDMILEAMEQHHMIQKRIEKEAELIKPEPDKGEMKLLDIISMSCEHFVEIPTKCKKRLAKELEQYHNSKTRKELIDFINWFRTEIGDEIGIKNSYFVDKYLSKHNS